MIKEENKLKIKVTSEGKGMRLDEVIQKNIEGVTRSYVQKIIDSQGVFVNGKEIKKSGYKLKGGEEIDVLIPQDEILEIIPEDIPIDIIYQDDYMVILNKGPNMVVHPANGNKTGTLVNAIMYHIKNLSSINGIIRPGIVHRLDKDTSGIIVIAKNDKAHIKLVDMFKEKELEKTYICICKGRFKNKIGRIETLIGRDSKDRKKMRVVENNGKIAITNYEVVHECNDFSLVKVKIETGRTHQIRVHMKHLNHPILGDEVYGKKIEQDKIKRQMLHSYKLVFNHPITAEKMEIIAEIPEDIKSAAKYLNLDLDKIKG